MCIYIQYLYIYMHTCMGGIKGKLGEVWFAELFRCSGFRAGYQASNILKVRTLEPKSLRPYGGDLGF